MAHKTKKKFEEHLNEVGATYEECEYLTKPHADRKTLKPGSLRNLLNSYRFGYVLRKYDPIRFETEFKDWERQ